MRIFRRPAAVSLNLTNIVQRTTIMFMIAVCSFFLTKANSAVLVEDDFNDGTIDANKWRLSCTQGPVYGGIQTSVGNTVLEEEGTLKIIQASTDWGGRVYSKTFKIDTLCDLIITCRTKSHFANTYLKGAGLIVCAVDSAMDTLIDRPAMFMHYNYSYVPSGGPFEGFGQNPNALLPPIWDEWVDEKLVYSPTTGKAFYTLNGTTVEITGGLLHTAFIKLDMFANGWYTGHYFYLDWIKVEQDKIADTTAILYGSNAGGDLTGTYPNPTIKAGSITADKLADGVAISGPQGPKGDDGLPGAIGPQGQQGPQGDKGDAGATGATGDKGEKGDTGPQGIQGIAGPQGDIGPQGVKGDKGDKGDQGIQGIVGPTGPQGPIGMTWRGPWNIFTCYSKNDAVSYNGSTYIAIASSTAMVPTLPFFWNALVDGNPSGTIIMVSKGSTAPTGYTFQGTWSGTIVKNGSNICISYDFYRKN